MTCPNGYGNITGYVNHGCRCDDCRTAARTYDQARRDQARGGPALRTIRLPIEPLDQLLRAILGCRGDRPQHGPTPGWTPRNCAAAVGVHQRQWVRWINTGTLSAHHADQIAIRLGYHPAEIWGDDWWDVARRDVTA